MVGAPIGREKKSFQAWSSKHRGVNTTENSGHSVYFENLVVLDSGNFRTEQTPRYFREQTVLCDGEGTPREGRLDSADDVEERRLVDPEHGLEGGHPGDGRRRREDSHLGSGQGAVTAHPVVASPRDEDVLLAAGRRPHPGRPPPEGTDPLGHGGPDEDTVDRRRPDEDGPRHGLVRRVARGHHQRQRLPVLPQLEEWPHDR